MRRLDYIDSLKGLAIVLVVWGHIAEKSMGIVGQPFNLMYSSFHMPLFMFLSGMFAFKHLHDLRLTSISGFLKKKVIRVLLPFITIGGFYSVIICHDASAVFLGIFGGYWFLPALFICLILGAIQRLVFIRIGGVKL